MDDQDLSGDDIKYIDYWIVFTKPDLVATLEAVLSYPVDYSTNGGSLGGLKVGQFMGKVAQHQVTRPTKWKQPGNEYPPGATDDTHWTIPEGDLRYIEFQYVVKSREPKQDPNYDRDRNRDLRGIQKSIDDLAKRFPAPPGTGTSSPSGTPGGAGPQGPPPVG
jgi:hypothetical protein